MIAPGERVGERYEVHDYLAQSRSATVLLGRDRQTGQPVALKVLPAAYALQEPSMLLRFQQEGEALRRLDHPHIVRRLDELEVDGAHIIVMEYLPDGSLRDRLRRDGPLAPAAVLDIGLDLTDALTRAHRLGIVHRDLKPENVLIAPDGTYKLSDFGLATGLEPPGTGMLDGGVSSAGASGTLPYMPPEALRGVPLDARADIWSLGVLLYEMLTGVPPFTGADIAELALAILEAEPTPPDQLVSEVPPDLSRLLQAMLVKERARRIQSVRLVGVGLESIKQGRAPLAVSGAAMNGGLRHVPREMSSFIGRQRELAAIESYLRQTHCHLLTLTGPGGVGKTRLMVRAAHEAEPRYADGVVYVDLAPLSSADLVPGRIARSLGVRDVAAADPAAAIVESLQRRHLLLLLDNFEHVIESAPLVDRILSAGAGVDVMVTSRRPLGLYGEQVLVVPPLDVTPGAHDAGQSCESVELFVARARAVDPDFRLTEANRASVTALCRHLDGLPLAIELAAARVRHNPPAHILDALRRTLGVLDNERLSAQTIGTPHASLPGHRSLNATVDWSYRLLSDAEQALLNQLAVFRGGATYAAVSAVSQVSADLRPILESLQQQSLIWVKKHGDGDRSRYHLLETVRHFAQAHLDATDGAGATRCRHATYYADLAARLVPSLHGPQQAELSEKLRREYDNIREALAWSFTGGDPAVGVRLSAAMAVYWYYEGPLIEGTEWVEKALAVCERVALSEQIALLIGASMMAFAAGEHARGRAYDSTALALARAQGDRHAEGWALFWLSAQSTAEPAQYREGLAQSREAVRRFEEMGELIGLAWGHNQVGEFCRLLGDFEAAEVAYRASVAVSRRSGNRRREAVALVNLGYVATHAGRYQEAVLAMQQGLSQLHALDLSYHTAIVLAMIAGPLIGCGQADSAARLLGASAAAFEALGLSLQPADRVEVEQFTVQARASLTPAGFDVAFHDGERLTIDEAVDLALRLAPGVPGPKDQHSVVVGANDGG